MSSLVRLAFAVCFMETRFQTPPLIRYSIVFPLAERAGNDDTSDMLCPKRNTRYEPNQGGALSTLALLVAA